MSLKKTKLAKLLEIGGFASAEAFLEQAVTDSVCLAICMNEDCNNTLDLEPDQDRGYCEECHTNSMKSGLVLLGVI